MLPLIFYLPYVFADSGRGGDLFFIPDFHHKTGFMQQVTFIEAVQVTKKKWETLLFLPLFKGQ